MTPSFSLFAFKKATPAAFVAHAVPKRKVSAAALSGMSALCVCDPEFISGLGSALDTR